MLTYDQDDIEAIEHMKTLAPEELEQLVREIVSTCFEITKQKGETLLEDKEAVVQRVLARHKKDIENPPKIGDRYEDR